MDATTSWSTSINLNLDASLSLLLLREAAWRPHHERGIVEVVVSGPVLTFFVLSKGVVMNAMHISTSFRTGGRGMVVMPLDQRGLGMTEVRVMLDGGMGSESFETE